MGYLFITSVGALSHVLKSRDTGTIINPFVMLGKMGVYEIVGNFSRAGRD